jgi:hypothetical protein
MKTSYWCRHFLITALLLTAFRGSTAFGSVKDTSWQYSTLTSPELT